MTTIPRFFMALKNNSMHFNSFASRVGFDDYFGSDNYPHNGHHNGVWGIYDEEFMQYAAKKNG